MKKLMMLFLLITFSMVILSAQTEEEEWDSYLNYYADTLAYTIRQDDTTFLNSLFDEELFLQKILLQKEDKNIQSYNKIYSRKLKKEMNLGEMIVNAVDTGHYDFVNQYTSVDGDIHMIFRLLGMDGKFNYHDYQLEWADSLYKITDVYFYANGEKLSETLQTIYRNLLRGALDVKVGNSQSNDAQKEVNKFVEIKKLLNEKEYQEANLLYQTIPEKVREERIYKYWRIRIAENLSNQEYADAITDYNNSYPDDPSFFFLAFDKALVEENWDLALKYLNKLDISVGLDPFLDYYRGLIYFSNDDLPNAFEYFSKIQKDYSFELLYDFLLDICITTKRNIKAVEVLNDYLSDFNYVKSDLIIWVKENYPDFSRTAEFLVWEKE
ncbi:MAG: hypothetical protein AB8F94_22830 [Saprospiraceae bacterium]